MIDKGLYFTQWIVILTILLLQFLAANSAQAGDRQEEMLLHPSAEQIRPGCSSEPSSPTLRLRRYPTAEAVNQ